MRFWGLALAFLLGTSAAAAAGTIVVPDDQATIQAAVDAAEPGDTIRVKKGTYDERVRIDDKVDLTLRFDPGAVLERSANGLTLDMHDCIDVTLRDVVVTGSTSDGIYVCGGSNILLSKCRVTDSNTGIYLEDCTSVRLDRCVIERCDRRMRLNWNE